MVTEVTVVAENGVVAMDTPRRSQKYRWLNAPIEFPLQDEPPTDEIDLFGMQN
jgi:hypothetical protein